jgi:hypothetical protein
MAAGARANQGYCLVAAVADLRRRSGVTALIPGYAAIAGAGADALDRDGDRLKSRKAAARPATTIANATMYRLFIAARHRREQPLAY